MPDFPRPDLVVIEVTISCNMTPGCTPETPCDECQEILADALSTGHDGHVSCTPEGCVIR